MKELILIPQGNCIFLFQDPLNNVPYNVILILPADIKN